MIFIFTFLLFFQSTRSDAPKHTLEIPAADTTSKYKIIDKPISYSKERETLSIQYLKERHGLVQTKPTIRPVIIVLHYTGGGNLKSNFNYFNKTRIEEGRKLNKKASDLNVSAHYLVDRDGTIYRLMPDTLFARHAIGLNYCAIGVENIGGPNAPLTQDQVKANAQLIRMLARKFPIKYVIGHCEYEKFKKSTLWKESDPAYITHKSDPGNDFLKQVRKLTADLKMKDGPE